MVLARAMRKAHIPEAIESAKTGDYGGAVGAVGATNKPEMTAIMTDALMYKIVRGFTGPCKVKLGKKTAIDIV